TNFTYEGRGRIDKVTNTYGHVTDYNYFDDTQRKVEMIYPNLDKITYKFDIRRLPESMTDERGKITTYEFDPQQRLTKITDPLGHVKEFGYDLMSNMTSYKDPLGNITTYTPDDFNRLKEITYPAATVGATPLKEKFVYDKLGRIKEYRDTADRLTSYNYDDANRTNTVTNPDGETTTIKYNQRLQTFEVKDAINQVYTFSYDPLGRMLSQTRAGGTMSFEYDEVGNRKKRTDYMGRVTNYTFDNLNRLTKTEYDHTNETPKQQSTYGYDDISRLTSAVNEVGTVSFGYDSHNRLLNTTDVFGKVIAYEYERTPTVNQKRLKLDGALYATYNFDDDERLSNIVNAADSTTISFGYHADDLPMTRTYPNGVSTSYEFDNMRRLKRLTDEGPNGALFDRQYGYNAANQISQITEPSQSRIFGYDNADRLTGVTGSVVESYMFDNVGNRTSSHRSSTYGYQPFNKIASTQTATYGSDANGNMTTKSEGSNFWRYSWDYENRLAEASTRKQKVRYKYDALGRRVSRGLGYGKEQTKFTYDGQDVLVDDNFGTQTKYLNGAGIDNKLRQTNGSSVNYFLSDHQLSTYGLTNSTGNLSASQTFDSYGNVSNNSFPSRYQYTGREYDSFTGLYHYRARAYDSNTGRFMSEDPAGFVGGMNLYSYVGNNPTQFTDPFGLFPSIWPFDYHQQITAGALNGVASPRDIQNISRANEDFDAQTQDLEHANSHAMSFPGQSPDAARARANAFVRDKICLARKYKGMGLNTDAMYQMGAAVHTMQDYESPAHNGFQEAWPYTYWDIFVNGWHYPKETALYTEDQWKRAENNTRRAWAYFKGYPLPNDFFSGTGQTSCECPK
ncbi:MAG: RHS repeat-associated core domain-containing protein, partial [Pyrinomonadaceae bacterium]